MDWEKLKIFNAVAQAGSFTAAAKRLNTSQSALSRQIKGLEEDIHLSLFTRHARGLVLTQEGEHLFATARAVAERIEATQLELMEAKNKPFGPLRVTTTQSFGTFWLSPRVGEFVRAYPDIDLQLILSDELVDLATGEAEIAIRFSEPTQADLIQRPLTVFHHHIYAAPEYLSKHGTPASMEDLDNHDLLTYGPGVPSSIKNINWIKTAGTRGLERKPLLEINSIFGVMQAVRAGTGLAAIPDYLAAEYPELIPVLRDWDAPAFPVYLVYPGEIKNSKRVNAFKEFLIGQFRDYAGPR
jgi:DNA-binding transcriptional LysR family regulator